MPGVERVAQLAHRVWGLGALETHYRDFNSRVEALLASLEQVRRGKEVDAEAKVVLAGAEQSTQSTVPDTGVAGMTIGLIISIALFAFFAYIVFINPRKYALSRFERGVMDDLD